ncbi:phytase [Streptomyces roseolus]|uniref:phytase n=1 Tax=Streptomyces roseolus TaxID=67358 RepID=UPI003647F7C4
MSASALAAALGVVAAVPATPQPVGVTARVETPVVHDDEAGGNADADGPAVRADPTRPGRSLVIGTLKEGGLDVYGLDGRRLQHIAAPPAPGDAG